MRQQSASATETARDRDGLNGRQHKSNFAQKYPEMDKANLTNGILDARWSLEKQNTLLHSPEDEESLQGLFYLYQQ